MHAKHPASFAVKMVSIPLRRCVLYMRFRGIVSADDLLFLRFVEEVCLVRERIARV
jgi:hypothetical protein